MTSRKERLGTTVQVIYHCELMDAKVVAITDTEHYLGGIKTKSAILKLLDDSVNPYEFEVDSRSIVWNKYLR